MKDNNKLNKIYFSVTRGVIDTLLALFVLGMIANLYVEIPEGLINQQAWSYVFSSAPVIAVHVVLGILVLIVSAASLVLAVVNRNSKWILGSIFGLVFTALAAFSGSVFVSNGGSNLSSLLMAFGFLGALVSYALAVFSPQNK